MEKERQRANQGKYPDPIYPSKQDTDNAFDEAIALAIENVEYFEVFNGTHNAESVRKMVSLMKKYRLSNNDSRLWFSQLYGMRDNITFKLASEQYNVAKYVPYGPIREVMPYLVRRAEENSSMSSQAGEELTKARSA
jgi:proline dehydrogenase